ncbi:MAG: VOC family protein [Chloroflexi bacterium]|nr:VOC family protein [Chloroflexota bacterium]
MAHPVVHWEITAKDAKKLSGFYTSLFDWKINVNPMPNSTEYNYVVTDGEGGINGGIFQAPENMPTYVTFYVQVDDLQKYLDKAESLGGKALFPPTPIPGMGAFAMFGDPAGNTIGLFKAS